MTIGPITYPSNPQQVQVVACPPSSSSTAIATSGNVVVSTGANVAFIAGQNIGFGAGFTVQRGGVVTAVVSPSGFSTALSPAVATVAFGDPVTFTETTSFAGVNNQTVQYSTDGNTWTTAATWSGPPPSGGIQTLVWTLPNSVSTAVGATYQIRALGGDGPVNTPYATESFTVTKATPVVITQTFTTAHTVTQADLNALLQNPYSSSVAAPTGSATYSIVVPSGSVPPTKTEPLTVGLQLAPGTYAIQVSYAGDANYNGSGSGTIGGNWLDSSADTFTYDAAGRLISAAQDNGLVHTYSPDNETNLSSVSHNDTSSLNNGIPDWWQYYYFQENNINNYAGDPAGDGIDNLMKYMLGQNPLVASSGTPVNVATQVYTDGNAYYYFTYTAAYDAVSTLYMEQSSDHGATWQYGPSYFAPVSTTDNGNGTDTIAVRCTTPLPAAASLLFRLYANGGADSATYAVSLPAPIPAGPRWVLLCLPVLLLLAMGWLLRPRKTSPP